MANSVFRSMPRTVCIARPAISRILRRTHLGSPEGAGGPDLPEHVVSHEISQAPMGGLAYLHRAARQALPHTGWEGVSMEVDQAIRHDSEPIFEPYTPRPDDHPNTAKLAPPIRQQATALRAMTTACHK
ncbi:hypothetical protein FQR65_LT18036 [Abscondita terminalis]|nr:hypothetical protein FQR65_LT18036 [Abscondita terminalis]